MISILQNFYKLKDWANNYENFYLSMLNSIYVEELSYEKTMEKFCVARNTLKKFVKEVNHLAQKIYDCQEEF